MAAIIICVKKENSMRRINPGCKFIGVFLPALILSLRFEILLNVCVFAVCMLLLILSRVSLLRMGKLLLPVTIIAAGLFMTGYIFSSDASAADVAPGMGRAIVFPASTASGLVMATRIFAFVGLGMLFSFTTNMKEFIYSLEQQFRLPSRFAYGILAAFHLGPMMPYEYKKTSHAFLARGQKFFPLSPNVLVPFIIKSVRWSESLAVAMESKGFDENIPRTRLQTMQVRWFDYAFVVVSVGFTILGIIVTLTGSLICFILS